MPALNGNVRDHVLREVRMEIRDLAGQGFSAKEIDRRLNGHHTLSAGEQSLIDFMTHHAVAEAKGYY